MENRIDCENIIVKNSPHSLSLSLSHSLSLSLPPSLLLPHTQTFTHTTHTHTHTHTYTLRFAARMKSIENSPVRNSLLSKEPASGKLLLQIEQLKKELAMRDAVAGIEPWLPELTR